MFPISDEASGAKGPPVITIFLILANIAVFVFLQGLGTNDAFTYAFSLIPREILTGHDIAGLVPIASPLTGNASETIPLGHTPINVYLTVITSMFMHGGLGHLLGNMLFLWIFGDNLEHAMGSWKFLIFYLVCGTVAAAAQVTATVFSGASEFIPMLGASGAISGILGGYLVLYPRRSVNVLIGWFITQVPAFVALGLWFGFQLLSSLANPAQVGGVAYAAHIGGFVTGLLLVRIFATREEAADHMTQWAAERRSRLRQ